MNDILTLDKISLSYQTEKDEIRALESISFSVDEGEFVAIIGPSGC